jgi:hypothetical protein
MQVWTVLLLKLLAVTTNTAARPIFQTKTIAQTLPFVSARNVLQIRLAVSERLPAGSIITISGLTGTATPDVQDNFPVYGEVSENEQDLQALRA